MEQRSSVEALVLAEKSRSEERRLRHGDWFYTIVAGVIGGIIALVGSFVPFLFGERKASRRSGNVQASLDNLHDALKLLNCRAPAPRPRGSRSNSYRTRRWWPLSFY